MSEASNHHILITEKSVVQAQVTLGGFDRHFSELITKLVMKEFPGMKVTLSGYTPHTHEGQFEVIMQEEI